MASLVMYTFFKWTSDTKKTGRRNGYFAFYIPQELLTHLNTSELELKDEMPETILKRQTATHLKKYLKEAYSKGAATAGSTQWETAVNKVNRYTSLRKKSVKCVKVLAQSQNTPKALNIALRFPSIFRIKHVCSVLSHLPTKSNEWVKFRYEGKKEIFPHDYGLIEKASVDTITEKDRLIFFETT